jgi:hypothetical protein
MDEIKREYGKDLVLYGGFHIQNWSDLARYEADIRRVLPVMMQHVLFLPDPYCPLPASFLPVNCAIFHKSY